MTPDRRPVTYSPSEASWPSPYLAQRQEVAITVFDSLGTNGHQVVSYPGLGVAVRAASDGTVHMLIPFPRWTLFAVSGKQLYVGDSQWPRILAFDLQGQVRSLIRIPAPSRSIHAEDLDLLVGGVSQRLPSSGPGVWRRWREMLADLPLPETAPFFSRLLVDTEGNLWVQGYRMPGEETKSFWVLDSSGKLIASATLPEGLAERGEDPLGGRTLKVGGDWVLGVWTDADGIEYVRLYHLRKATRGAP